MRSDDERLKAVLTRAEKIREREKKKKSACVLAAGIFLTTAVSALICLYGETLWQKGMAPGASASVFADGDVPGYIVTGILAFIFGVSFTLLCSRIKKSGEEKKDGGTGR